MATPTIASANSTGTLCTSREQDIPKAKDANMFFRRQMSLREVPDMRLRFTAIKRLQNTLRSGMLTSKFLRKHFHEAVREVTTLNAELTIIKEQYHLSDEDFVRFHAKERKYLDSLKQPPIRDELLIRYVDVLDELEKRWVEWDSARGAANNALTEIPSGSLEELNSTLMCARIRIDTSYVKLQNVETLAAQLEGCLNIQPRWEIGSDEYNRYQKEATLVKYRTALDELERLVVMRLFELSKLSMSGTDWAKPAHREATTKYFKLQ
ncbi:hypothetical protein HYDPIDRAFT_178073 [Hydnomerulius pinastri MD-312]|uniref:Uncharacterized protein n=1 Tax=Hydnomerulius pinastri MD-312 TaxID=994086 RepID=A0A0C9W6M5_9AGAM|nr:hypothetical protein HYDPIDRAFT_178073 [Hydnomerulius pinastri MD-312]